MGGKHLNTK